MEMTGFLRKLGYWGLEELKKNEWGRYKRRKKARLKNRDFTIIASNCNGSFMYYDMELPYLTPTVNLAMEMEDFVTMVENLPWYMEQEFREIMGEEGSCPMGLLGRVKVNFVHYDSFEEAVRKWDERKRRINWDNLFIVGTEKDGCTYETIRRFDSLPYKNKVIFTHVEYPEFPSAHYMKGFEEKDELGVLTSFKDQFLRRRYLDDFDYVDFLNRSGK